MSEAENYLTSVRESLVKRDPQQPEFLEAVDNFFHTITPVLDKHPEYIKANLIERLIEPERAFQFRVP